MQIAWANNTFLQVIEYIAVFCCGMVGGSATVRRGYDITAIIIASWLTALGGGIIRDVMLGVPPVGVNDKGLVLTALASGIAMAFIYPEVDELRWSMLTLDALAMALFAVEGTAKALTLGSPGMTAAFMGMFTALGGGLIRDTLINKVPMIIADKHWYFVPAAVGCVCTVGICRMTQHGIIGIQAEMALELVTVALVVTLRLLSVKFDIAVPGAITRSHVYLPGEDHRR